ncbi:hypothetical protein WMF38_07505 [Sorangium sp. So ce118]
MDAEVIMSRPMSVFIDFHDKEDILLSVLAEVLGCSLTREDRDTGTIYRHKMLDTEFTLFGDHGLEDDRDIKFTTYNYQLNLTAFDAGLRTSSYARMYEDVAIFVAERLCTHLGSRTQVVANLQRIVTRFEP